MDCSKTGALIAYLRRERAWTQKQLADALHLSDRTISKWERGVGCPDVSLLPELAQQLYVPIEVILSGELPAGDQKGTSMKQSKFYVCPTCGNVIVSTEGAQISCCGAPLAALEPQKATAEQKLHAEQVEDEWFVTSDHPMTKDHFISFVAFVTGDRIQLVRQYPEWCMQTRVQKRGHGKLIWYCTRHGAFYQLL